MPGLHHGIYTDEWGIGTTDASLDDFFASARGSGSGPKQPCVDVTLRYEDDSLQPVRIYVDGVFNPYEFDGRTDYWKWAGRIDLRGHRDNLALIEVSTHEGVLSLRTDKPHNTLMIRHIPLVTRVSPLWDS